MSVEQVVNLAISIENPIVSRAGFANSLILSAEAAILNPFQGKTKLYSSVSELLADGFSPNGATARTAQAIKAQNPAPATFKVGKRSLSYDFKQEITLTVLSGVPGDEYSVRVANTVYTYTRESGDTNDDVATKLAALIDADAGLNVSTSGSDIVVETDETGFVNRFDNLSDNLAVLDTTVVDDGYTLQDLSAIVDKDSDWFAFFSDVGSKAQIETLAVWADTQRKIFYYESADSEILDAEEDGDIASILRGLSLANTMGVYSRAIGTNATAAGWAARSLIFEPGDFAYAHKTISGAPTINVSPSEYNVLKEKNMNVYSEIGGSGHTLWGYTPSGELLNNITLSHFLYFRIVEDLIAVFKANRVVPFTDDGLSLLTAAIASRLDSKIGSGLARPNGPTGSYIDYVNMPRVSSIALSDRVAGHVPGVTFSAQLSGSVLSLTINGSLSLQDLPLVAEE